MAQYQHLPIYKATYDLLREVTQATANFPKAFKYSLGDKLRAEVVEMVVFVFKANSARGTDRVQQATVTPYQTASTTPPLQSYETPQIHLR